MSDASKKLSVCICLSGQMRNFEQNFEWLKMVDPRLKISVVVATWTQRGGKLLGRGAIRRIRGTFPEGVADALPESWTEGDILQELPGIQEAALSRAFKEKITRERIQEILPDPDVHVEDPFPFSWFEDRQFKASQAAAPDPFSLSMLYKIWQADVLRKNRETRQGKRFDFVIRARPDLPFEPLQYSFLTHVAEHELYIDRFDHGQRSAGDSFALGSSAAMDYYADFFMTSYRKALTEGRWTYIHSELYEYLLAGHMELRTYTTLGYSPDRLVQVKDVLDAIERRLSTEEVPKNGYHMGGQDDCDLIRTSVGLASRLMRHEAEVEDGQTLRHVVAVLARFDVERDGGFLRVIADCLRDMNDPEGAILAFALSIRPTITEVPPDHYTESLYSLLQAASSKGYDITDPSAFLDLCYRGATKNSRLFSKPDLQTDLIDDLYRSARPHYLIVHEHVLSVPGYVYWFVDHYQNSKSYSAAESALKLGLAAGPGNGYVQARLALLYASQGRVDDVVAAVAPLADLPEGWVHFLAGKALHQVEQFDAAEQSLRRAIQLYPSDPDYYMELSMALHRLGKSEEAVAFAYEAASRSPESMAHRHNNLGNILQSLGRLDEAEAAFREALKRNPEWDGVRAQIDAIVASRGGSAPAA